MSTLPDLINHLKSDKMDTTSKLLEIYKVQFHSLPSSTQTVLKRVTFSVLLISYFLFLIYGGPVCIILSSFLVQFKCFDEIISVAYKKYDTKDVASFRFIAIYFFVIANFYCGGEHIIEHFHAYVELFGPLQLIANYHRFASFCLHFWGVMWFVLSLKKGCYRKQFSLLAWTHIILLVIVVQSNLIMLTIFQGMIWFIICITTITSNDIMAYICGKFFGRTPLIQLSPKKTWEGFIGAAFSTIIISCTVAHFLSGSKNYVCPIEYQRVGDEIISSTDCTPDVIFRPTEYVIFGLHWKVYPFVLHTFWLALFGSVIAPFGGFFASGFKRAFKVKDFGDTIPGHGGFTDRIDCQLVMVTFVNVYISSFIKMHSENRNHIMRMFDKVMNLSDSDQLDLFYRLQQSLRINGYEV